uniref:V-type proton ATPase subunit a n=1 Tax=Gadus morhua TaxID=8049 RepID=A0A8C5CTV1_GADMO
MGSMFRSEEVCLVQLFLQSGSAYNCVSELGELGLVEFRDLNPNVNAFQRKFVGEVRRCEELEKTFSECPGSVLQLRGGGSNDEVLSLHGGGSNDEILSSSFVAGVVMMRFSLFMAGGSNDEVLSSSFVAGVVHPWKVPSFERLLWRACRGYIIVDFREMEGKLEHPDTGEMVQWTVFLISYWGEQIGQKVKKICDCFRTQTFAYPESTSEREDILRGLQGSINDIKVVLTQTETFLQQLLVRAVALLPQWRVAVQKCKAVEMVLNLCSPSVTDKCLIAEAWCPVTKLPELQSALREGGRKSGSGVDSFYNRLPCSKPPPTLFPVNSFTSGFQNIVEAYGVANYREVNPALFTIITFPFLFAVMFGDMGHGLLMALLALYLILEEKDPKFNNSSNEIFRMMFGGRYLILLMGLFSIYTGAIYNECFSRGVSPFSSGWHVEPMFKINRWNASVLAGTPLLAMDPVVPGVFTNPYPFGIDPVWGMANNKLTFLNSYKMKMSVIMGVIHMTFGVCLSSFNYVNRGQISNIFLVLIPELLFMLCLFGYLVFMVIFKWIIFTPDQSKSAPSILIHFIDMFLFTENAGNQPLYHGQTIVQKVLVVLALCSVPVLLFGKPTFEYITHKIRLRGVVGLSTPPSHTLTHSHSDTLSQSRTRGHTTHGLHFLSHSLNNPSRTTCLGSHGWCLVPAELSEVLWVMVMRNGVKWQGYTGSVALFVVFAFFALLTVAILLVMEGLSAFLHALRLHWVEFQNKFYGGSGYKLSPFCFTSLINASVPI